MRIETTRYTPVPYANSSGGLTWMNVNSQRLRIDYPVGRRRLPVGVVAKFVSGTWLNTVEHKIEPGVSTIRSGSSWSQTRTDTLMGSTLVHIAPDMAKLKTISLNKNRSKAKGTAINLPLLVAEFGQTCELFTGILAELRRVASMRTRKGRKLRLVDLKIRTRDGALTEGLSNKILAYNYGLAPFVSSITDSMDAASNRADTKKLHRFIHSTHKYAEKDYTKYATGATRSRSLRVSVRTKGLYLFNSSALLNAASQLRLTNPLEFGLERIPFSFLADWVFNSSQLVSSLDNPLTMGSTLRSMQTARVEQFMTGSYKEGTTKNELIYKQRDSATIESTIADFVYEPSLSARRLLNAIALTRQRLPSALFKPRSR